ncbi:MAG: hypothetical protein AB7F31_07795 [Parachlamydiales bacterium]
MDTRLTDDPEVARRLALLGLHSADEVARLSCDELVWQFGEEGLRIWERLQGEGAMACEEQTPSSLKGEWELFGLESLRYQVTQTFDGVVGQLTKQERRLRSVQFQFQLEQGRPVPITLHFSRGAKDGSAVFAQLERHLQFPSEPILVEWEVTATFRICARSLTLFPPREEELKRRMAGVLEELKGRRVAKGAMGVVWDEPHSPLPERRAHLESLLKRDVAAPLCTPTPVDRVGKAAWEWEVSWGWWTEELVERRYIRDQLGRRFFWDRLEGGWYRQ